MGRVFRRLAVLTFGLVLVWMLGTAVPGLAAPSDKAQPSAQGQANGQAANAQGNGPANGQAAQAQGSGQSSGNGANVSGPYDPNGVGLPSGNGKSENNNGNRPCAGCVGNADAKNPPGQLPGGSDPNKGYECDENQGVGKTNPAHSGCGTSTSVTPPGGGPPGGGPPGGGPPGGGPPGDNPPGGGPAGGPGGVAGIQTTSPPVESLSSPPDESVLVAERPAASEEDESSPFKGGRLAFTGVELLGLALFGMIALAGGLGVRWATRRVPQA